MIDSAIQRGLGLTATTADLTDVSAALFDPGLITAADRGHDTPLYSLRYNPTSRGIDYWTGHDWQPHKTPKTLLAETRELIGLRDVAESLVTSQRDGRPPAERDQLRGHLNTLYDNYVRRYGPLNRFTWVYPNVTQERHDQRLAAAETAWRTSEGNPGRPYTGPVPDELAAQWDTDAWEAPAPVQKTPPPRRRHAPRPRLGAGRRAGNLRRGHRPSPQSTHLLHRPAHRATRPHHRRHPRRSAGDVPGPRPARRHRRHRRPAGSSRRRRPRPHRRPGLSQPR